MVCHLRNGSEGLRAQRKRPWNLAVNSQKVVARGGKLRHRERGSSARVSLDGT